jgi:hypothetical protein
VILILPFQQISPSPRSSFLLMEMLALSKWVIKRNSQRKDHQLTRCRKMRKNGGLRRAQGRATAKGEENGVAGTAQ